MKWNYKCSNCYIWSSIEWNDIDNTFECHSCKKSHKPPRPENQFDAFVDTHEWPSEMETTVINIKGKNVQYLAVRKII